MKHSAEDAKKLIFLAREKGLLSTPQTIQITLQLEEYTGDMVERVREHMLTAGWITEDVFNELCGALEQGGEQLLDAAEASLDMFQTLRETVSLGSHHEEEPFSLRSPVHLTLSFQDEEKPPAVEKEFDPPAFEETLQLDSVRTDEITETVQISQAEAAEWSPAVIPEKRYQIGKELGRGGLGVVAEAFDHNLGRKVARKTLLTNKEASKQELRMFIEEARLTGQLEHPNIMPVYEIGMLEDEQLYYTMRLLPPNNLEQAINEGKLSVLQFVRLLQQVCMGLEYAHSRGVVHRDIKPANIILGQFGEVLILDWGTAKILEPQADLGNAPTHPGHATQTIKGTPAYMAPELIKLGLVTPYIDQYALGVILYKILTGEMPVYSENIYTLMFQICSQEPIPPRERAPERHIPEELEAICLKMLEKDPDERFASCREVHDRLEDFLEGTKEKERRRQAALDRMTEATEIAGRYHENRAMALWLKEDWEKAQKEVKPWEALDKKRKVWDKERAYHSCMQETISLFGEAIQKYDQALDHDPSNKEARRGLADLHWSRFLEAEQQHDELAQIYHRDLVKFYDDGHYERLLEGKGSLTIDTNPSGANVKIYRYEEQDCQLVPVLIDEPGCTPLRVDMSMGSHLIILEKEGFRDVRYPLYLNRCEQADVKVNLYTDEQIGEDFVYIPAGSFPYGGDKEAPMSEGLRYVELDDFFISKYPITFAQYADYLNEKGIKNPDLVKDYIPRSIEEEFMVVSEEGNYIPLYGSLFSGKIKERYPEGSKFEFQLPVFGVTWFEVFEYCEWRSQREGKTYRLPTEEEWEKASSGCDNRLYPWGNSFEATFAKTGLARSPDELQPEPVGCFVQDTSPYGVRDMVGTVAEWTQDSDVEKVKGANSRREYTSVQRGAGWVASNVLSYRIGSRVPKNGEMRSYNCGFRVVTIPEFSKES